MLIKDMRCAKGEYYQECSKPVHALCDVCECTLCEEHIKKFEYSDGDTLFICEDCYNDYVLQHKASMLMMEMDLSIDDSKLVHKVIDLVIEQSKKDEEK